MSGGVCDGREDDYFVRLDDLDVVTLHGNEQWFRFDLGSNVQPQYPIDRNKTYLSMSQWSIATQGALRVSELYAYSDLETPLEFDWWTGMVTNSTPARYLTWHITLSTTSWAVVRSLPHIMAIICNQQLSLLVAGGSLFNNPKGFFYYDETAKMFMLQTNPVWGVNVFNEIPTAVSDLYYLSIVLTGNVTLDDRLLNLSMSEYANYMNFPCFVFSPIIELGVGLTRVLERKGQDWIRRQVEAYNYQNIDPISYPISNIILPRPTDTQIAQLYVNYFWLGRLGLATTMSVLGELYDDEPCIICVVPTGTVLADVLKTTATFGSYIYGQETVEPDQRSLVSNHYQNPVSKLGCLPTWENHTNNLYGTANFMAVPNGENPPDFTKAAMQFSTFLDQKVQMPGKGCLLDMKQSTVLTRGQEIKTSFWSFMNTDTLKSAYLYTCCSPWRNYIEPASWCDLYNDGSTGYTSLMHCRKLIDELYQPTTTTIENEFTTNLVMDDTYMQQISAYSPIVKTNSRPMYMHYMTNPLVSYDAVRNPYNFGQFYHAVSQYPFIQYSNTHTFTRLLGVQTTCCEYLSPNDTLFGFCTRVFAMPVQNFLFGQHRIPLVPFQADNFQNPSNAEYSTYSFFVRNTTPEPLSTFGFTNPVFNWQNTTTGEWDFDESINVFNDPLSGTFQNTKGIYPALIYYDNSPGLTKWPNNGVAYQSQIDNFCRRIVRHTDSPTTYPSNNFICCQTITAMRRWELNFLLKQPKTYQAPTYDAYDYNRSDCCPWSDFLRYAKETYFGPFKNNLLDVNNFYYYVEMWASNPDDVNGWRLPYLGWLSTYYMINDGIVTTMVSGTQDATTPYKTVSQMVTIGTNISPFQPEAIDCDTIANSVNMRMFVQAGSFYPFYAPIEENVCNQVNMYVNSRCQNAYGYCFATDFIGVCSPIFVSSNTPNDVNYISLWFSDSPKYGLPTAYSIDGSIDNSLGSENDAIYNISGGLTDYVASISDALTSFPTTAHMQNDFNFGQSIKHCSSLGGVWADIAMSGLTDEIVRKPANAGYDVLCREYLARGNVMLNVMYHRRDNVYSGKASGICQLFSYSLPGDRAVGTNLVCSDNRIYYGTAAMGYGYMNTFVDLSGKAGTEPADYLMINQQMYSYANMIPTHPLNILAVNGPVTEGLPSNHMRNYGGMHNYLFSRTDTFDDVLGEEISFYGNRLSPLSITDQPVVVRLLEIECYETHSMYSGRKTICQAPLYISSYNPNPSGEIEISTYDYINSLFDTSEVTVVCSSQADSLIENFYKFRPNTIDATCGSSRSLHFRVLIDGKPIDLSKVTHFAFRLALSLSAHDGVPSKRPRFEHQRRFRECD